MKMVLNHLTEKKATTKLENRSSPEFNNPEDAGIDKLTNSTWIQDALTRSQIEDDDTSLEDKEDQIVDIDYEIADVF